MKLVFIIDHLRPDGTQTVLVQLVEGLSAKGYCQTVICLNDSASHDVTQALKSSGATVKVIGKRLLATGYGIVSLIRYLRSQKFDVAITFLYVSDVLGRTIAKWAKIPRVVSSLRARNANYSYLQRSLVRSTMKVADAIIVNSEHVREFAIKEEGANPDRIYVIPNGVNVDKFANPVNQALLREKLGLPEAGCLLGTVGRLTKQKGIDVLLNALSLMSNQEIRFVSFGCGEDETKLRQLAIQLGLESCVHFAGYRRDLSSLIGALDVYVHPSRFEGMPNAVLEAMAAACPIVATDIDGTRELIQDGKHGWLVPPDDSTALACALKEAFIDPDEARRRGAAAQQRVAEHFTVEKMVSSWEQFLSGKRLTL